MRLLISEVAAAMGGSLVGVEGDPVVSEVVTDSRRVSPGSLFVALRGERLDGHDFDRQALGAGAVAVVTVRGASLAEPRVEVDHSGQALRDLAALVRSRLEVPVLAVTGSTGKTSTKDLLAGALGPGTWAAPHSYNNEVGVPLTVLGAPEDAESLVLEVGSRGKGHIAWLAPVVDPWVAVLTNVGVAHLETFGDLDAVADAKWELMEGLRPGGVGVIPAEDERLMRRKLAARMTFGVSPAADVAVEGVRLDDRARPSFHLRTPSGHGEVHLSMAGAHQALNAAAATAAALAVGRSLEEVVPGLEKAAGSPWRMEVHSGRFLVVNDAYNANPASMSAALETVAAMPGRHLAVLGRMAELGPAAREEHLRIGRLVVRLGYAALVVVGEDPGLADGAGGLARGAADQDQGWDLLTHLMAPGDVVLVKGSRVVGLERLAERLVEESGR
jgi:UDP-N-acetylmuramoyl-tripeptide--D-alanyl-D-alanine ligase